MGITVVKPGDNNKQGNATCPQCGEVVIIDHHFGDPAKCGKCGVPYTPRLKPPKYV